MKMNELKNGRRYDFRGWFQLKRTLYTDGNVALYSDENHRLRVCVWTAPKHYGAQVQMIDIRNDLVVAVASVKFPHKPRKFAEWIVEHCERCTIREWDGK